MRRTWTKKEEQYMCSKYLIQPIEITAKRLKRSVVSVKRKATKLGLNHYLDNLGAKSIARCFGCDVSVVIRWIDKYSLPANEIIYSDKTRYDIDTKQFWEWAQKNKELINWARYELGSLAPEPEWVRGEKNAFQNHNSRKRFSEQEKSYIRYLLLQGKSYKEISAMVGRSYNSINHLCRTIHKM